MVTKSTKTVNFKMLTFLPFSHGGSHMNKCMDVCIHDFCKKFVGEEKGKIYCI